MSEKSEVILEVKDLKTYFHVEGGAVVKAVDGVSYSLRRGETIGIVGESGSGKSVTNLSIMGLIPSPPGRCEGGQALFHGEDLLAMKEDGLRKIRGNKISMIFQDPMTALNPFLRISTQIMETLVLHRGMNKRDARDKAIELLKLVGINQPEKRVNDYPHQFSGGMRQRAMIAMALSCEPEVLIADEPTSALDVTIQAQIVELIHKLASDMGTAVVMITHDLGIVAGMCDSVVVMYAGRTVETGTADKLFGSPKHPYTQGLIASVPRLDKPRGGKLYSIPGSPPNVVDLPVCCPFWPRCSFGNDKKLCQTEYPPYVSFGEGRMAACWRYNDRWNTGK